jgi:hypothetical protein
MWLSLFFRYSRSVSRSKTFSFVNVNAVRDGVSFAVRDALRNISNNGHNINRQEITTDRLKILVLMCFEKHW